MEHARSVRPRLHRAVVEVSQKVDRPLESKYWCRPAFKLGAIGRPTSRGKDNWSTRPVLPWTVTLPPSQSMSSRVRLAISPPRRPTRASKGVTLAGKVGLGKTIEAALILCQLWAERRPRLWVVGPASIRKQWSLELEEKFNLPTTVLDSVA